MNFLLYNFSMDTANSIKVVSDNSQMDNMSAEVKHVSNLLGI